MSNSHQLIGHGAHKVIAVHGWLGDKTSFEKLWPYVDQDSYSWAFMDWRGYGGSITTEGSHLIEEVAGDILALADDLGWERFSLLGHSMGGMAIQRVVALAPDRVTKLVGLNAVPASGVPFDDQGWALFSGAATDPTNRRAIIDFTTGGRLPGRWLDEMVQRSLQTSDQAAFADYLVTWAKTDFHELVEGAPLPVLVLVGEHDPALSEDVMRATWLTWYPNASLEVIRNAGHYPMEETPLALVASVEAFLGSSS